MNKKLSSLAIAGIVAFIIVLMLGNRIFKIIEATERAVIFKPLSSGLNKDKIFEPGLAVVAPWNTLIVYDISEQILEERMDMLDKKGLSITIDITLRYKPMNNRIGDLHEKFRGNYKENLVRPEFRAISRKVLGQYEAEEIFSTMRDEVAEKIEAETEEKLLSNNIEMKALLIRSVVLPDQIRKAIDNKEEQRQIAEAMQYKLEKEEQEAERKRIEAKGISDYNRIISASLTDKILKQKGIDATIKLSESENSKVVVVGSGKDGLPLILGNN